MKGLILKDLFMAAKYCKMFFLIDAVFIAMSFFSKENAMFIIFPILLSCVLPITILSYDERCKWTEYSGALPYSNTQIVSAKYLTGLIIEACTAILVIVIMIIRTYVFGNMNFTEAIISVVSVFAVSLVFPSFCLPFCFRFGTEKGRIVYYILIALITAAAVPILNSESFSAEFTGFIPVILVAIVMIYALSWVISAAIYNRKNAV